MSFVCIATIAVGGWMVLNGILHDIFVLSSKHGKTYNRDLLRLLMGPYSYYMWRHTNPFF